MAQFTFQAKKLIPTFSKAQEVYLFCLLCFFFPPQIDLQLACFLFPWEQFAHIGSASPEVGSCVLGELCPEAGIRLDIEMLDLSNGKTVLRSTRIPLKIHKWQLDPQRDFAGSTA